MIETVATFRLQPVDQADKDAIQRSQRVRYSPVIPSFQSSVTHAHKDFVGDDVGNSRVLLLGVDGRENVRGEEQLRHFDDLRRPQRKCPYLMQRGRCKAGVPLLNRKFEQVLGSGRQKPGLLRPVERRGWPAAPPVFDLQTRQSAGSLGGLQSCEKRVHLLEYWRGGGPPPP